MFLSPAAEEAIGEQRKLNAVYREKAKEAYDEWVLTFPSEAGTPIGVRNLNRQVEKLRTAVNNARTIRQESPIPH